MPQQDLLAGRPPGLAPDKIHRLFPPNAFTVPSLAGPDCGRMTVKPEVIRSVVETGYSETDCLRQKPSCRPVCNFFAWTPDLSAFPSARNRCFRRSFCTIPLGVGRGPGIWNL